ncbi:MAG: glycosyl transferase, partial [Mangrovicoccus sp.]|nr:glycosyl transferase [Mangrovicoccus sp.]
SDFGIKSPLDVGPAMALGTSETTLLQMTAAYAGILNGGSSVTPYGVRSLTLMGDDTPLLGQEGGIGERVISEHAARELVWMMHQVIESGTGRRAQLGDRPAAGKTGTTSAARDAWFIGFTGDYVTGVWLGYDDNRELSGTTGGGLPAEIWRETMIRVHEGLPVTPLPMDAPPEPEPSTLTASADPGAPPAAAAARPSAPAASKPATPKAAAEQAAKGVDQAVRRTGNAIGNAFRSIFGRGG